MNDIWNKATAHVSLQGQAMPLRLALTDFNRLRWSVAALRLNTTLQSHLQGRRHVAAPWLTDSAWLIQRPDHVAPEGALVVLWDGYNSLLELRAARPELNHRSDLQYLVVGHLEDLASEFPANASPLFPATWPGPARRAAELRGTWRVDTLSTLRATLRPWRNRQQAGASDKLLRGSPLVVFCGLVRPQANALRDLLRGVSAPELSWSAWSDLGELNWRDPDDTSAPHFERAWERLRLVSSPCPADLAALYALANVLMRMRTLGEIDRQTSRLFVNEFGVHGHLDPYDAAAYRQHLFIDFGSTRGPDLIYPRSLDLHLQRKRVHTVRLGLGSGLFLPQLQQVSGRDFLALCAQQATEAVRALAPGAH